MLQKAQTMRIVYYDKKLSVQLSFFCFYMAEKDFLMVYIILLINKRYVEL